MTDKEKENINNITVKVDKPLTCKEICPREDKNCYCQMRSPKHIYECDWILEFMKKNKR